MIKKYTILFIFFFANIICQEYYLLHNNKQQTIKPEIQNLAKQKYAHLNSLNYFDFDLIMNEKWQNNALSQENIRHMTIETKDCVIVNGYFLDRGSDKLLLIGQGFISPKEALIPFFKLFPDYDIAIIDYRWHQWHKKTILKRLDSLFNTLKKYIYDSKNEVIATVKFLRKQKKYKSVTGIGQCYSALVYAIAQTITYEREGIILFDNIIIDSGFYNTKALLTRIMADPKLCWENKFGGAPFLFKWITNNWPIFYLTSGLARLWLGKDFTQMSMETYLPRLRNTKILFIHGAKDLVVPIEDFNLLYCNTRCTPHVGIITPFQHTTNHLTGKEMYAYAVDQFINSPTVESFVEKIK